MNEGNKKFGINNFLHGRFSISMNELHPKSFV